MGWPISEVFGFAIAFSRRSVIFGRFLIEDGVDAGDDDVHLREDVVGEIEVAFGEDVDFDSGEDRDAVDFLVGFANALDVFDGALVVEAVGEGQVLGVVGDGHVLIAARFRGLGHFFDGVPAVGFDGVHVHVALQVLLRDQRGQGMLLRRDRSRRRFSRISGGM